MRSLKATFSPAAPYALVPIRLALFAIFFYHGTQMLFGWFGGPGIAGTGVFLGSLGLPLAIQAGWGLVTFFLAIRIFRWE